MPSTKSSHVPSTKPSALPPGIILAGGQSRRMGTDKAWVQLQGQPLIAHLSQALRQQVSHITVISQLPPDTYADYADDCLHDSQGPFWGPLAGIATALHHHSAAEQLLIVPCDTPCLPPDLGARLSHQRHSAQVPLAVAHDGERIQPLFAILSPQLLPSLQAYLHSGQRRLQDWLQQTPHTVVDFSDCSADFANINNHHDLEHFTRPLPPYRPDGPQP